jgi:CRP-like cAMP-binding protein/tRNA A-37 threonylcarbamoyl transferase component Bud32
MAEPTPVRRKIFSNVFHSPDNFSKGRATMTASIFTSSTESITSLTVNGNQLCSESPCNKNFQENTSCPKVCSSDLLKINEDAELPKALVNGHYDNARVSDWNMHSPTLRRSRIRTLELNHSIEIATPKTKPETTPSRVIASAERMKRNTDSMIEDAVISQKLKRRLAARRAQQRPQHENFVTNTALSDFIAHQISRRGGKINAEAAARPTTQCILNAAEMAQKTLMEGYFTSLEDEATSIRVRKLFVESVEREEYYQGDIIFRKNDIGDRLYVIEEGAVQFLIGEQVAGIAAAGSVFGELSLVYGLPRQMTVQVTTPCFIAWTIHELAFRRIQAAVANKSLKRSAKIEQQNDSATSKSKILNKLRRQASSMRDEQETASRVQITAPVMFESLVREAVLGKGTFGLVLLVTTKQAANSSTDNTATCCYGLKRMSKAAIVRRGNQKRVLIEKNALQTMIECPFIIKLFGTYQDSTSIYFLTDFVQGGTLVRYMIEQGTLTHSESLFFCSCLACALVHVHKMGFIHRDVKPENCLIGTDGYLKLCDFGMAKRLPSTILMQNGGTEVVTLAFTMCGTPEFMAPEYILSTGYNKGVDWWALGCMLVEMYTGQSPFDFGGDLKSTFKEICLIGMGKRVFSTPPELKKTGMEVTSSFAKGLLCVMSERLGKEDDMEVLRHRYFSPLNMDDMQAKRVSPPYIPHVTHPADARHFISKFQNTDDECQPFEGDNEWCRNF